MPAPLLAPVAWVLSLLLALPETAPMPGWAETAASRTARLGSIARDLALVVYGDELHPAAPGLPAGADWTAAAMVELAQAESGLGADIDAGHCYRGTPGTVARCDRGTSWSMWQVHLTSAHPTTREGWTALDLVADRTKAIRAALAILVSYWGACAWQGEERAFVGYMAGSCAAGEAVLTEARRRLFRARRLLALHPRSAP